MQMSMSPPRCTVNSPQTLSIRILRLAPTEFIGRSADHSLCAVLALVSSAGGATGHVDVMHCSTVRTAMIKHRLHTGDRMVFAGACRTEWSLAVPPLRAAPAAAVMVDAITKGDHADEDVRILVCWHEYDGDEATVFSLPEPNGHPQVTVGGGATALHDLGPVVVNKNGSISRISNWQAMNEVEKDLALKMVGRQNRRRLAKLQDDLDS
jgi:hypothetical protein